MPQEQHPRKRRGRFRRTSRSLLTAEFQTADLLIGVGDFAAAKKVLSEYLSAITTSDDPEARALAAITRAKIEFLTVEIELRKQTAQHDQAILTAAYIKAARASYIPKTSPSRLRKQIAAHRADYLAQALKCRAFVNLEQQSIISLEKAHRYFGKAVKYIEKAAALLPRYYAGTRRLYLVYWDSVVATRVYLLRFMDRNRGDDADFGYAQYSLKLAISAAGKLCLRSGPRAFFPNYFYSVADLANEFNFFTAAKAFKELRWADCIKSLETWRTECPEECKGSWKAANVTLRLLCTKLVRAVLERDDLERMQVAPRLKNFSASQRVGAAARYLAQEVLMLQEKRKDSQLVEHVVNSLSQYFPMDAQVSSGRPTTRISYPLASLPKKIYDNLREHSVSDFASIESAKAKTLGALEAFLGHLHDYYMQTSGKKASSDPTLEITTLVAACLQLQVDWATWESSQSHLQRLSLAINQIVESRDSVAFTFAYRTAQQSVNLLHRHFPVIVDVPLVDARQRAALSFNSFPDWATNRDRATERINIHVPPEMVASMDTGKYYLRPGWRRGNRQSYNVDSEIRLFPVAYIPRWDFWEMEAANAALVLTEGVLFEHLRTAVREMKRCEGSPLKPKVGAVIVKNGEIVARAFRGEDGTDRHAEEIAISKCNRDQLRAATMITTLEPCTAHGRSPSVASCSLLLLANEFRKVVIGIPDPDNRIRGNGDKLLRQNEIVVAYFPSSLAKEIWDSNVEFVRDRTKDDFKAVFIPKVP